MRSKFSLPLQVYTSPLFTAWTVPKAEGMLEDDCWPGILLSEKVQIHIIKSQRTFQSTTMVCLRIKEQKAKLPSKNGTTPENN